MEEIIKYYTNGEVTIVWKPALCTHASFCWKELPEVFKPRERPWIDPMGAPTDRIIQQIKRCPSGALGYFMNNEKEKNMEKKECDVKAKVINNGPLLISGGICVEVDGKETENKTGNVAFCRCGKSRNQPYCDGSHLDHPFEN